MKRPILRLTILLSIFAVFTFSPAQNDVKGQKQLTGGLGQFGTTYTLKNGWNFTILSAKYTLDPFNSYGPVMADSDSKLVVIDFAIKNATPSDAFISIDGLFTLVDDKEQLYPGGSMTLESQGNKESSFNLRPGQGIGQPALKDPLRVAFMIPSKAHIAKIMINQGRLNTNEEVFRYLLTAPPKTADSKEKTFLAPLPEPARDPADPFGCVALDVCKATMGAYVPSGPFFLRCDSLTSTSDPIFGGNPPDDGKKYWVATMSVKAGLQQERGMFDVEGGDGPLYEIKDSDGETYKPLGFRKPKADEDPDHQFKEMGEEYTFRIVFALPKDAKPKKFQLGAGGMHRWSIDLP